MSAAKHTPGPRGTERLRPVCEASGRPINAFASGEKDFDNRAACPICSKVVKLRKQGLDRWPNTIPHHHMPALAAAAVVQIEIDRLSDAAPELLKQLRIARQMLNAQQVATVWDIEAMDAAIAKATGSTA